MTDVLNEYTQDRLEKKNWADHHWESNPGLQLKLLVF